MSVLRTNLRLLWQCPSVWALYACTCLMVGFGVLCEWTRLRTASLSVTAVLLPVLAAGALPIGRIVAMMQVEILSHPFALTLPGVQNVTRKVVFIVGLIVGLAVMLIIPRDTGPASHSILLLLAIFGAALTIYLVGVGLTYLFAPLGLIAAVFGWFVAPMDFNASLGAAVAHIVLSFPIPVVITAVLSTVIMWSCLGRPQWRIRIAPSLRQCFSSPPVPHGMRRRGAADSIGGQFLLERARATRHPSSARYVWGMLYAWLVPGGGGRIELILTVATALACGALAWYLPSVGSLFIIIIMSYDTSSKLSLHSNLLIAGGRRERFLGTFVSLVIVGIVWTISIALSFAAVDLMGPYLPQGRMRALELEQGVASVDVRLAVSLTAVYPLLSFIDLVLDRSAGSFALRAVLLVSLYLPIAFAQRWLTGIPLAWVALILTTSWLVCAYGLYRITMRRDLVSARPEKAESSWLETHRRIAELRGQGRK